MDIAIRLDELTKYYGKQLGVADLNLEVKSGEVFGYLGPNGAGKTTTIRILLDLIRPTRGKATVLGLDSQADSLLLRRSVGAFRDHGCKGVSLTVTGVNQGAISLYERIGFRTIRKFNAFVWETS